MTKAEIINDISEKSNIDKEHVSAVIESFFSTIKSSMAQGNNIYFRGFGSFVLQKRAKKIGRIITANKEIVIDEHFIVKFKPAKIFSHKIKRSESVKKLL